MFYQALGLLALILVISFGKVIYDFVRQSRKVRSMSLAIARGAVELAEVRLSNTRNFNLRQLAVRHLFAARGLVRRLKMGAETLRGSLEAEIGKHESTRRQLDEFREVHSRLREQFDTNVVAIHDLQDALKHERERSGSLGRTVEADKIKCDKLAAELRAAKLKVEGWERAIERVEGFDMVTTREAIMTGERFKVYTTEAVKSITRQLDSDAERLRETANYHARLNAVIEKGRDAFFDVTENIPDLPEFAIFRRFGAFAEERNTAMMKKGDELAAVAAELTKAERLASDRAVTISERDVSIRELRMRAVTPFVCMLLGQVSNISDYDGKSIAGKRFRLVETRKPTKKKGGAK